MTGSSSTKRMVSGRIGRIGEKLPENPGARAQHALAKLHGLKSSYALIYGGYFASGICRKFPAGFYILDIN